MLVGIKPTVGRISRYGVIPITADHDTAGPDDAHRHRRRDHARRAREARRPIPNDPATTHLHAAAGTRLHQDSCKPAGSRARASVFRAPSSTITLTGSRRRGEPRRRPRRRRLNAEQAKVMADAIAVLKQQGAIVVDPADVPSIAAKDPKNNFAAWDFCSGAEQAKGKDDGCSVELQVRHEARLQRVAEERSEPSAPVKSLTELREWNIAHAKRRRDQVRAVASRHLRRDGSRDATARATRQTGEGLAAQPRRTASTGA